MARVGESGRLYLTPWLSVPQQPLEDFNLRMGEWLREELPTLPRFGAEALRLRPELAALGEAHPAIRAELDRLLHARETIPCLADLHPRDACISSPEWRNFVLMLWGHDILPNQRRCPSTMAAVRAVPGVHSALFSILGPGTRIPAHRGWAAGIVRCHYPLLTPANESGCYIEVAGRKHAWREAEPFLFDDTREHFVVNDTDESRVVLIVDFEPRFSFWRRLYTIFRYHLVRNSAEVREICRRAAPALS
jgi:beta-hydroxylase